MLVLRRAAPTLHAAGRATRLRCYATPPPLPPHFLLRLPPLSPATTHAALLAWHAPPGARLHGHGAQPDDAFVAWLSLARRAARRRRYAMRRRRKRGNGDAILRPSSQQLPTRPEAPRHRALR
jgi:hypothetical protein